MIGPFVYRFSRFERKASIKQGKPREQNAFDSAKQVIAPIDGGAQCLVARQSGSAPAGQQSEPIIQTKRNFFRRNHFHPCRSKLDSQWNTVEPSANFGDGWRISGGQLKIWNDGCGAIHEQPDRWDLCQFLEGIQRLGRRHWERGDAPGRLTGNSKGFTARCENMKLRTRLQKLLCQHSAGAHDLLAIIENEKQAFASQKCDQRFHHGLARLFSQAQSRRHGRRNQRSMYWKMCSGRTRSRRRCSPRSISFAVARNRDPSRSTTAFDRTICPPCADASMRARRLSVGPK